MEDRASNFFSYICQYLMKQFRFFREKDGIRPISCLFIYLFAKLLFICLHHNDTSKRKRRYIKFYFSRIKILFSLTTNSVFPVISSISTTLEKSSYRFIFPVNVTSFWEAFSQNIFTSYQRATTFIISSNRCFSNAKTPFFQAVYK